MIVLIDNYDSFTFNVYQYVQAITTQEIRVVRNNTITVAELATLNPTHVIISPGPGRPEDGGISLEAIIHFAGKVPILGICLGHQAIVQAFGGNIISAKHIVHGKVEAITHDSKGLFRNIPNPAEFTRYHSLAAEEATLPTCFEVTARSQDGEIMGIRHKEYQIEGVQFHPESLGSPLGAMVLKNFLHYKREPLHKPKLLTKVMAQEDLQRAEAADFMDELTEGNLPDSYIAAMLVALQAKGVSAEEVAGCAEVLKLKKQSVPQASETVDMCGTGGDGIGTFNISSFSALIAASMGIPVAKHGNRAVSSKSGSADFYTSLGIPVKNQPEDASRMIQQYGFSFLFAPLFHGAMRHAGPVRKELGIKTLMNLLGPLVNPAESKFQLIGVYHTDLCPIMARAARLLGVKQVMTVHSQDGLDEISPAAPTRMFFIDAHGTEQDLVFDPSSVGITNITLADLAGGNASMNARIAEDILALATSTNKATPAWYGSSTSGADASDNKTVGNAKIRACLEACCLNAGAAAFVYDKAPSVAEGYRKAKEALITGKTAQLLKQLREEKIHTPQHAKGGGV